MPISWGDIDWYNLGRKKVTLRRHWIEAFWRWWDRRSTWRRS